jgi:DNA-binding winged helix-turn-helix (wHTH) protein
LGDTEVSLTAREFAVLQYLMRRAGEVVAKSEILDNVWDFAFEGDPNIVEVYIHHFRKKLDEPFGRHLIETIRGAGYRLDPKGGALLVRAHDQSLTANVEQTARVRSRDIAGEIARGGVASTPLALPVGDETLVQVVDAGAGWWRRRRTSKAKGASARLIQDPADTRFRVVARRVITDRGAYTVYVAASLEPVTESTRSLAGLLFLGLPALLPLVGSPRGS